MGLAIFLRQGFTRSRNQNCLFARAETEGHNFLLVWVDNILVAPWSITMVSNVKIALEAKFYMKDRRRIRIRHNEGKCTVDQKRYTEPMREWFSNVSMQNHKYFSWFEFETSESSEWRQRTGSKNLKKLGWITSVSDQTDEARHQVYNQHSVQTHICTYQSPMAMQKMTAVKSSIKTILWG